MTLYKLTREARRVPLFGERFDIKQDVYIALSQGVAPSDMQLDEVLYQGKVKPAQRELANIIDECLALEA